jgi:hypothetical protein
MQKVWDLSQPGFTRLTTAARAVCWEHPQTDRLIAPWQGEPHLIRESPAYVLAALDAIEHDWEKHS